MLARLTVAAMMTVSLVDSATSVRMFSSLVLRIIPSDDLSSTIAKTNEMSFKNRTKVRDEARNLLFVMMFKKSVGYCWKILIKQC